MTETKEFVPIGDVAARQNYRDLDPRCLDVFRKFLIRNGLPEIAEGLEEIIKREIEESHD